jgi:undecaprenyl diphosphate synthase
MSTPAVSLEEFTPLLEPSLLPQHVAIIMDGNRRWAHDNQIPAEMGHWEGAEVLTEIVRAAARWGIKTLTVYAFSTENWSRSGAEIDSLMNLFQIYLSTKQDLMIREGICLNAIGDLTGLPEQLQKTLYKTIEATRSGQRINLVIALNYGGRDEIKRVISRILKQNEQEKIPPNELTEKLIAQYLDTSPWGDPDFLIRTGGEFRLSNFMLWQLSYTEFYISEVFWPQFTPQFFHQALLSYQNRQRRFGGSDE